MTLGEFKEKVYSTIEEYSESSIDLTSDEDLAKKMNSCVNTILSEVSRFKKINAYIQKTVQKGTNLPLTSIDENLYQVNIIRGVEYEILGNRVLFKEDGIADIYYYKYPLEIDKTTLNNYVFEVDNEALEIMLLGVAGLLLASDVSNDYGQKYTNMYREKISQLDSRNNMNSVYIAGGVDI